MNYKLRFILIYILILAKAGFAFDEDSYLKNLNCVGFTPFLEESSLSELNPEQKMIYSMGYPSHLNTLFRGAYDSNPQFTVSSIIDAIFYKENWRIGSPMFFLIRQVLTGNWDFQSDFFPSGGLPLPVGDYLKVRMMKSPVESLLKCKQFYSFAEAEVIATDLMNRYFSSLSNQELSDRYFNVRHSRHYDGNKNRQGFGNNAIDFIISTTYDQIATLYGMKTLVFQDMYDRSVDWSYFNYELNGIFHDNWVDSGEINTPGYLRSEEILGIQVRNKDRLRKGWGKELPDARIDFSVYRIEYKGKTFGLVLDGANQSRCMLHGSDGRLYECSQYWTYGNGLKYQLTPIPFIENENVSNLIPLMGILNDCDNSCSELNEIQQWYDKLSTRFEMPPRLDKSLKAKYINGKKILLFRTHQKGGSGNMEKKIKKSRGAFNKKNKKADMTLLYCKIQVSRRSIVNT